MNLRTFAHALDGVVSGDQVRAPGPGHSPHDRSLIVWIDPQAPDLFRTYSFAGDDWRVCRDHVKRRLGIVDGPRAAFFASTAPKRSEVLDVKNRIERALAIWREAGC